MKLTQQKIDIHLHLARKDTSVKIERGGAVQEMIFSGPGSMLEHMDTLGIRKAVVLSSGEESINDAYLPGNDVVREIAERWPERFAWACNVDAREPETFEQRLRNYKNQGAVLLGELTMKANIGDSILEALFAAAESVQLPVLFHMSPDIEKQYGIGDDAGLPGLEGALQRFPDLIFIGHSQPFWHEISGGARQDFMSRNMWGSGPVEPGGRIPYLLDHYPNLVCDLSAGSGGSAIMRDETFGLNFLEEYQERLLFGTDMANKETIYPLGPWLDMMLMGGRIAESTYQKIMWENAERLLG